jgi:hypothetical protein
MAEEMGMNRLSDLRPRLLALDGRARPALGQPAFSLGQALPYWCMRVVVLPAESLTPTPKNKSLLPSIR